MKSSYVGTPCPFLKAEALQDVKATASHGRKVGDGLFTCDLYGVSRVGRVLTVLQVRRSTAGTSGQSLITECHHPCVPHDKSNLFMSVDQQPSKHTAKNLKPISY